MTSARSQAKSRAVGRNARVVAQAGKPGVVLTPDEVVRSQWRTDIVAPVLSFVVYGVPAPQGSKNGVMRGGKIVMQESSAGVDPWRKAVRQVALLAIQDWSKRMGKPWVALDEPVLIQPSITMPANAASTREGRVYCTSTPDLDKLQRAIGDALAPVPIKKSEVGSFTGAAAAQVRERLMQQRRTVSVLHDDSRIVAWDHVQKVYPATTPDSLGFPGVTIQVWRMEALDRAAQAPVLRRGDALGMKAADFARWARPGSGESWEAAATRLWGDPGVVLSSGSVALISGRTVDDDGVRVGLRVLATQGPDAVVPVEFVTTPAGRVPPRPTR